MHVPSRPVTTLFMLMSADGKISTGAAAVAQDVQDRKGNKMPRAGDGAGFLQAGRVPPVRNTAGEGVPSPANAFRNMCYQKRVSTSESYFAALMRFFVMSSTAAPSSIIEPIT